MCRSDGVTSNGTGDVVRDLFSYYAARPWLSGVALVLAMAATGALLLLPRIGGDIIGELDAVARLNLGQGNAIALLVIAVLVWAGASSLQAYLVSRLNENYAASLRSRMFDAWMNGPIASPDEVARIGIHSRVINDAGALQGAVGSAVATMPTNIILLFGALSMMLAINVMLVVILVIAASIVALGFTFAERRITSLSQVAQGRFAVFSAFAHEVLGEPETVRHFKQIESESVRFRTLQEEFLAAIESRRRFHMLARTGVLLGAGAALAVTVAAALGLASRGLIGAGDLISFLGYGVLVATAFTSMTDSVAFFAQGAGSLARIREVLELPASAPRARSLQLGGPAVELIDVTFCYPGADQSACAVDSVTLEIPQGGTVALVGQSGCGKSTLAKIISGDLIPQTGTVRLGLGAGSSSQGIDHVRCAYVGAHPFVFSRSVRENVAYADPNFSGDELENVYDSASLVDFLAALPSGDRTILADAGKALSTGQRQRVGIARALLTAPHVMVLDECTSGIDSETEESIVANIMARRSGRTTVIVSHRLSSIRLADMIILMENGRIIARGKHEELVAGSASYRNLFAQQLYELAIGPVRSDHIQIQPMVVE